MPVTIVRSSAPRGSSTATVIDTFGADDVVPLSGGCTCCSVRVDLQNALHALLAEREKKPFSRIVIESGEALAPILRTFASERALGGEYYVEDAPPLDGNRFMLTEAAPLSWDAFSRFVATLTALRGTDLLQMKGMVNISGCLGPVAVQLMGHLAARPVELQTWRNEDHTSRLTFITRGIEQKMVRDLFEAVRAFA